MSQSTGKKGSATEEQAGPFELRSSENSTRSPLSANFRSQEKNFSAQNSAAANRSADNDDDPAIGSLEPPVRNYGCANYDTCLDLAAALNWASFTCGSCRGTINESLMWRARHATRKDAFAKAICELPPVTPLEPATANGLPKKGS